MAPNIQIDASQVDEWRSKTNRKARRTSAQIIPESTMDIIYASMVFWVVNAVLTLALSALLFMVFSVVGFSFLDGAMQQAQQEQQQHAAELMEQYRQLIEATRNR